MNGNELLRVEHLTKTFGKLTVLNDISTSFSAHEVVSVIGPSGGGKSTFLRCLNRLETPTSGQILVDGIDMCDPDVDLDAMRRKMGMVFQSFHLLDHMPVAENIMLGPTRLWGIPEQQA